MIEIKIIIITMMIMIIIIIIIIYSYNNNNNNNDDDDISGDFKCHKSPLVVIIKLLNIYNIIKIMIVK